MFRKKYLCTLIAVLIQGTVVWAGDTAIFADLGFSPDGRTYMFAQYGVLSDTLRPWADLFVVDVGQNNFVPDGKLSYVHDRPVTAGQDGSGAFFRLLTANTALAERYRVNFLLQGQPLYIAVDGTASGAIEFRDFGEGAVYRASLVSSIEGSGANMSSSFHINLERTARDGSRKTYTVGTPQVKRGGVASYRIRKVMTAPADGSMIFVIEMKKQNGSGQDIRYMVEAIRL